MHGMKANENTQRLNRGFCSVFGLGSLDRYTFEIGRTAQQPKPCKKKKQSACK